MTRERGRFTPQAAEQWIRILKYVGNWVIGSMLLIYSTVFARPANPVIVGAGLALLLGYPALQALRSVNGTDHGNDSEGGGKP